MSSINDKFKTLGFLDIQSLDGSIKSNLKYATTDNFVGEILYHEPFGIYAEPRLAHAIAAVSRDLHKLHADWNLIIYDAARPVSVQQNMFEKVKGTPMERYVANPYGEFRGGFHNYGMAVDMSIVDATGEPIDMGSNFDEFCEMSHVGKEYEMMTTGILLPKCYANRMLLYALTSANGLYPYPYEWWHYQVDLKEEDKNKFILLNF